MENNRVVVVNSKIARYDAPASSHLFYTTSSAEAARSILQTNTRILEFVGGDGTLSATLNDVLASEPDFLKEREIVINPRGSGNDRIKSLREFEKLSDIAGTSASPFLITDDYLLATINGRYKRYVFNIAGIGLDSHTLLEYEAMRKWLVPGKLRYFGAAARSIFRLNGYKGNVQYQRGNSDVQTAEPIMFLFMLGKYFGGGMAVNHQLNINDGRFESLILNRGSHGKLFAALFAISVLQKSQEGNPLVDYLETADRLQLTLSSRDKFFFESDGEVLTDEGRPVEVHELQIETAGKITYRLE